MSLIKRLQRRLGYDTTVSVSEEVPAYYYTVEHTNGETSNVVAHGYDIDGAFATFYVYTGTGVWVGIGVSATPVDKTEVRVLESIKEITKEQVATSQFSATIDRADNTVTERNTDLAFELDE
jgi:hypothetical protein